MANAKKSTKKVSKKVTATAKKTVAKKTVTAKTVHSTQGRMPKWAATKPQKAYVLEMRAAGKKYDATAYKAFRVKAKAKADKMKAKLAAKGTIKAKAKKAPIAKTKSRITAKKK